MKFKVKELGPIRQAEFEVGELTTVSGLNNTGKTYITHAMFGFLDYFEHHYDIPLSNDKFSTLLRDGKVILDLKRVHDERGRHVSKAASRYSKEIADIFGSSDALFENTEVEVSDLPQNSKLAEISYQTRWGTKERPVVEVRKEKGSTELIVSLLIETDAEDTAPVDFSRHFISRAIKDIVFGGVIPKPFVSSAERTGAAIFQKELDFTRNRLIEVLGNKSAKFSPFDLLSPFKGKYPVAVRKNVDFIRELSSLTNRESFLHREHPEVLAQFGSIIGGDYAVDKDGDVRFVPAGSRVKLALVESSSAVRSLLDIGFYLRHLAQPGHLLVVDEPELNLHPENQRKIARLFARLVNLGMRVFITTHSDYIIKEFNTLLMLNQPLAHLAPIMTEEGYCKAELLKANQIRSFTAITDMVLLDGGKRRTNCLTLVPAQITQSGGIELQSFDSTIQEMNRIQDAIIWGGTDGRE